ncbi:MAG TPA: FGGY family carbohydrate kinase [Candidatus Limnocylindrales bacterium]
MAIDIGSSSVRAELFDERGRPRRGTFAQVAYRPTVDVRGGVAVEFPRLLEVLSQTLDLFVARAGKDLDRAAGVGISCFLHSLAGVGKDGRPVTPLLTWADTTSAGDAARLRERLDETALWQKTGCPIHASYWPAKILHLRSGAGAAAASWAGAPELLFAELTGERLMDVSQASGTGLLDRRTGTWLPDVTRAVDVDARSLPAIAPPGASGHLVGASARRWPALAGIPWFVPWSDAVCGNVGLGAVPGGPVALQLGTSGAVRAIVADPVPTLPPGLFAHRLPEGAGLVGGQLSEGGGVAAAVGRLLGRSMRSLEADAALLEPDSHGLTVLPYLAGERGPGYHETARGTVTGVTLATPAAGVFLAVLESIAFRFAALDRALAGVVGDGATIVACGGALSRSPLWMAIMAAAIGRPIGLSSEAEASTRGAAIRALVAAGIVDSAGAIPPPPSTPVVPDRKRVDRYAAARARQDELYERLLGPSGAPR